MRVSVTTSCGFRVQYIPATCCQVVQYIALSGQRESSTVHADTYMLAK
jgi:hypothetical protein